MTLTKDLIDVTSKPFGTVFADKMAVTWFRDDAWQPIQIQEMAPMSFSPATHVFHYASSCFEGLKAHRWADGSVHFFRLNQHIERMQNSASMMCMPIPEADMLEQMIVQGVAACEGWVPEPPGSLYIRPTLIGTMPNIGAAATPSKEACLFVIFSPVGDYFSGGSRPLRILLEDTKMRTSPEMGMIKTGANYASALRLINEARENYNVDQVLFAPGNDVQETGAANFLLINDNEVVTKSLDATFLHGVTRSSLLELAYDLGYRVSERSITVEEVLDWAKTGEAALSGTAAVLAGIGTYIYQGKAYQVGSGQFGPNTQKLRDALLAIQRGELADTRGWTTPLR